MGYQGTLERVGEKVLVSLLAMIVLSAITFAVSLAYLQWGNWSILVGALTFSVVLNIYLLWQRRQGKKACAYVGTV